MKFFVFVLTCVPLGKLNPFVPMTSLVDVGGFTFPKSLWWQMQSLSVAVLPVLPHSPVSSISSFMCKSNSPAAWWSSFFFLMDLNLWWLLPAFDFRVCKMSSGLITGKQGGNLAACFASMCELSNGCTMTSTDRLWRSEVIGLWSRCVMCCLPVLCRLKS